MHQSNHHDFGTKHTNLKIFVTPFTQQNRNQTFSELRLEKHPDKTFIGRIKKGFDFLGYHFSPNGLSVADKTIEKFLARAVRLYEQEREEPFGSPLLGLYVRRWVRWLHVGITPRAIDVATLGANGIPMPQ